MTGFEGYVGIEIGEAQWADDTLLFMLIALLTTCSLIFKSNYQAFVRMIEDVFNYQKESNTPTLSTNRRVLFNLFMSVQFLVLSAFLCFVAVNHTGLFKPQKEGKSLIFIAGIFISFLLFMLAKKAINRLLGWVFTPSDKHNIWTNSANSTMYLWGISLYLPALWITFVNANPSIPISLFVVSFIVARFLIFYKSIFIFQLNPIGLLSLSLYLCALEILPLYIMYKGSVFLYKFIEIITL